MSTSGDIRDDGLEAATERYYGCYRGLVYSNEDPENLGRLQVLVPEIYGDEYHDDWALPKGIYAGNGIGSFFIPAKGDGIWVSFEGGDVRFPIWEYGWWGTGQVPTGAKPNVKVLQTKSGHRIEMNDDEKFIKIKNSKGLSITMTEDGITVEALNKEIVLYSNNSNISISDEGINIESDKMVNINGGFEALYNKITGAPIADVSQIGVSKTVKIG